MGRWLSRVFLVALLGAAGLMTGVARAVDKPAQIRVPGQSANVVVELRTIVKPGENLWKISARHLNEHGSAIEVAPFWRRVIETNLPTLRSGDPDLIYPGEVIVLPEAEFTGRP